MKISARNVLKSKVTKIVTGIVNAEVSLELPGVTKITSIITNESVKTLGLKDGQAAYAVIKASEVIIAID